MDEQNRNLILATVLSFLVIVVWTWLVPAPEQPVQEAQRTEEVALPNSTAGAPTLPQTGTAAGATPETASAPEAARLAIDTPRLKGSLSLAGGRIDTLFLKDYTQTIDPASPTVQLFAPIGSDKPYYAIFGWAPGGRLLAEQVPGANTIWSAPAGATLTPETPLTLSWDNGAGLIFRREISVDDNYMFSVAQTVENTGTAPVTLAPYGLIARHGKPDDLKGMFMLHEGMVSMADGKLNEQDYSDLEDYKADARRGVPAETTEVAENGWIGFTDHYWMSTLINETGAPSRQVALYDPVRNIYQTEAIAPAQTLAPGETLSTKSALFAGPKEWDTIRAYQKAGVQGFLDSIDWGWFFFLTKPIFAVLHWLHGFIGNMGWSIIALTLLIKALLFPLAYKSYVSMAKMKELQPEMEKIKERAGDDRAKLQQEMMALYKKEKVNPASGCLPILLQIPIFFSLYKVIFVTLELRHAPWVGWINDLSAPDPSSILNLFGLLPFSAPEAGSMLAFISLGILPILLGISMWLQQKLNPAPTDPTQAMIFAWMPWVFMFMLGSFASGLVLYWIANNTITFTQQYLIMRSQGYKPDVFGNIKKSFSRKKAE